MQDYLGAVGLLFFMFFLVAAATEAILETFRGILERFGVTWLRADKSLEEAVKMSTEFLPAGSEARGKVTALQDVVKNINAVAAEKKEAIDTLKKKVDAVLPAATTSMDTAMDMGTAMDRKRAVSECRRARLAAACVAAASALAAAGVSAEEVRIDTTLQSRLTYTDNVDTEA